MNKLYSTLLAGSMLVGLAASSHADQVTFLNFQKLSDVSLSYTAVAPSGTSTFTGTEIAKISFADPLGGLGGGLSLGTFYTVTLSITATTSQGANVSSNDSGIDTLTVSFTGGGVNYLTMTAGKATDASALPGDAGNFITNATTKTQGNMDGSNAPGQSFTGPNFVKFTSDVLDFTNHVSPAYAQTDEAYNFGFSIASGQFAYTGFPGTSYLTSFSASTLSGYFQSNSPVPEPGAVAMAAGALVSFGALRLRRRK